MAGKQQQQQQQDTVTEKQDGATPSVSPTLTVAGLGTMELLKKQDTVKLNKKQQEATGRETAFRTYFVTESSATDEVWWTDEETGDEVTVAIDVTRSSVTVDVPDGVTFDTVTVTAFGETRTVALGTFSRIGRPEKKDGKLTGRIIPRPPMHYGTTEYVRPSGATFVYAVKVTPSQDGKRARVAAILANARYV